MFIVSLLLLSTPFVFCCSIIITFNAYFHRCRLISHFMLQCTFRLLFVRICFLSICPPIPSDLVCLTDPRRGHAHEQYSTVLNHYIPANPPVLLPATPLHLSDKITTGLWYLTKTGSQSAPSFHPSGQSHLFLQVSTQ
ncbi:hypothetical protein F5Y07DRAFT_107957 [Xylaria sp. FL0933]|nr:hypothetical protein F5Y07DRAFT_107957 [Xylaria sp. FL0933]